MGLVKKISVLLAEKHALLRECLQYRLNCEPGLKVVAAVENADDAIEQAVRHRPQVVLMAAQMPGMSPFDAAQALNARCKTSRVILMCDYPDDRHIQQAQKVHASGCIAKTETDAIVITAIRAVAGGHMYYSPGIHERMILNQAHTSQSSEHVSLVSKLSNREIELLRNIAAGLSQKEIARIMKISEHTVHRHTTNVMGKLHIHDRVGLAKFAIREDLAQP